MNTGMRAASVPVRDEVEVASAAEGGRFGVLDVGDVVAPGDDVAVLVGLLHGDVGHEAGWGGAVPVVLAGLEEDAVAGADDLDGAALAPAKADALGDEDGLTVGVGVRTSSRRSSSTRTGSGAGRSRRPAPERRC